MFKKIGLVVCLFPSILLANEPVKVRTDEVRVWIDPLNGCEYLVLKSGTVLTPRLHPNGQQVCRPERR